MRTGLLMTPWPLMVAVIAPLTGRLADRYPVGILSGAGLTVLAVGLGLVSLLPAAPVCVGHRVADADLRAGVWVLQHAEQPGDHHFGAEAAFRRRVGDAGVGAIDRTDDRASLVALVFGLAPVNGTTITTVCAAAIALAAAGISLLRMMER